MLGKAMKTKIEGKEVMKTLGRKIDYNKSFETWLDA